MNKSILKLLALSTLLSSGILLYGQYSFPPLSHKGTISQQVGNTLIAIEYERPSVRNRVIFGDLVPWNKVWRTGAGHCTKIRFDKTVLIGNQPVDAGTYSLYTIPSPEEWIVILNRDTTLYGSYGYDSDKDAARFPVITRKTDRHYETLTIDVDIVPNDALIYISWADTQISFRIGTNTDAMTQEYIRTILMSNMSTDADEYGLAADYYLYQNTHYYDAIKLADMMISMGQNESWGRTIKMNIYEKLHLYEEALKLAADEKLAIQSMEYEEEKYRKRDLQQLEDRVVNFKNKITEKKD